MKNNTQLFIKLKRSAFAAFVLLVLIYGLGIYTTLFIEIPEGESWGFVMRSMVLLAHASLGTLLIFHTAYIVVLAAKVKDQRWVFLSIIGLLGVLLSVGTGASFITADNDVMSFLMGFGFALSLLAYVYGIYSTQE